MESQYVHSVNGQGVYQSDLNTMAEGAALADDRVLAEILRMRPIGAAPVSKAIIPTAYSASHGVDTGVVSPGTGGVVITPFRAVLGSTTMANTDAKENWRGVRSAVFVGSSVSSSFMGVQNIDLPAMDAIGGHGARWDLIYAEVRPDAPIVSAQRKVKDPLSCVVGTQTVVTVKNTIVTVGHITGTAGAGVPSLPTDGAGRYYIPLARIRLPANFTSSTTLTQANIWDVAPCVAMSEATGGVSCRPAAVNCVPRGKYIANQEFPDDPTADFPSMYLPPTMSGAVQRVLAIDFAGITGPGDLIDDSIDWRGRIIQTVAATSAQTTRKFPWQKGMTTTAAAFGDDIPTFGGNTTVYLGHTMSTHPVTGQLTAFYGTPSTMSVLTSDFTLYVEPNSGNLMVTYTTKPTNKVLLWMTASGQFSNRNVNW